VAHLEAPHTERNRKLQAREPIWRPLVF